MQIIKVLLAAILVPFLLQTASATSLRSSGLVEDEGPGQPFVTIDREIAEDTGMPPVGREVSIEDDYPIVEPSGNDEVEEGNDGERKLMKKKQNKKAYCKKCFWHKRYGYIAHCCTKKSRTGRCGYYFC